MKTTSSLLPGAIFMAVLLCASVLPLRADEAAGEAEDFDKTPPPASVKPPDPKGEGEELWKRDELTGDWGDLRKHLEDAGVKIEAVWVGQGFRNFRGGITTGDTAASTFDFSVLMDGEKLLGWKGAKFFMDFQDHAGPDPSLNLVGDVEKFTKLNWTPFSQVAELWYEQMLFNDKLRLKIGKVDANTEFSVIDFGLPFLSSSTQVTGTLFMFPTFPDPLPSVNLFFTPNDTFYASFGAYYANQHDRFLDFSGAPYAAQPTAGGTFFIGETGMKWKQVAGMEGEGNLRLGFWGHNGIFQKLDEGEKRGTHGFYAVLDQTLWKPEATGAKGPSGAKDGKDSKGKKEEEDPRGIRMFLEYAQTPGDVSIMDHHAGGGITWTGPLSSRAWDMLGVSYQYVHLSDAAGLPKSYESTLEGFYRCQLTPAISVMPDLQFIANPGGQYSNALVGTLQFEVHF
jgi:porin